MTNSFISREYKNQIKGCHNAERRIVKACERNENDLLMRNAYLYRYRVERSDLFDYAKPPGDILPTTGDAVMTLPFDWHVILQ